MDWLQLKESTIPGSGIDIFAVRYIPKNSTFSLYIGRKIPRTIKSRKYICTTNYRHIIKKKGGNTRESARMNQNGSILDALIDDNSDDWSEGEPLYSGVHIINDTF